MIKIVVISATGAARTPALLMLSTGIIKYEGEPNTYSHISAEIAKGKSIEEEIAEKQIIVEQEALEISEPQRKTVKKKKTKDN